MKARDYRGDYVSPKFVLRIIIIICLVCFGFFGYLAFRSYANLESQRGTREVIGRVRLADGTSEDELFIATTTIEKRVVASGFLSNVTEYYVASVQTDDSKVSFTGCVLAGVYQPVQCKADDNILYWVTIVDELDAVD